MSEDVDTQIEQLVERIQTLREQCLTRSASRVTKELKSLAKQEGRIIPYLTANFYLMNDAQSLQEPEFGAEVAIESIALLESEEKARRIQPDFPEDEYWATVRWMSACSYDNLAKHVAQREGYNSDGVHDCINDGMQVCRRTGKLECLTCFREYATDVYRASDDLDMALHHARFVSQHESSENSRRWVGSKDVAELLMYAGQIDAAWEAAHVSADLIETYHNPISARREGVLLFRELHALLGRTNPLTDPLEQHDLMETFTETRVVGEDLGDDLEAAKVAAVLDACNGNFDAAIATLSQWDRQLRERQCLDSWFEVRLRLIATLLLKGDRSKAESLGRDLEQRARTARDYLTQRRLKLLMEGKAKASPIAAVATLTSGPFSDGTASVRVPGDVPVLASPSEATDEDLPKAAGDEKVTPLTPLIQSLKDGIESVMAANALRQAAEMGEFEGRDDEDEAEELSDEIEDQSMAAFRELFQKVVSVKHSEITEGEDAAWLLFLGLYLGTWSDQILDLWEWSKGLVQQFPQHSGVLNLTADLADSARHQCETEEEAEKLCPVEQVEAWFRQSLDLDSTRANNYQRAGRFFQSIDKIGEAERCFARGFRLARGDSRLALSLAEIYAESERPRDALSVLDMCIREGTDDPTVFWQAALTALSCERWESMVSYADRFDELAPGRPWTQYYRAYALLESKRPDDALQALDVEAERNPECPLPVAALRAWAYAQRAEPENVKKCFREVLSLKLSDADYVTQSGLAKLFSRLDEASLILPEDDPDRKRMERLLLQSAFAPDELFERARKGEVTPVNFYVVRLFQDLGPDWAEFPGCLPGQADWPMYEIRYGVLAADEEQAVEQVLKWQSRCYPEPARVDEVFEQGGPYEDVAGVVWQSAHQPPPEDDEEEEPESES